MKRFTMLGLLLSWFMVSGAQLPDISLNNIRNEFVNLPELQGEKLTVIDFWATWCKPCLIAIPELNKLYEEYSDHGVNFIGINIDSPRNQSKVRPFASARGISYDVLLDPDQEAMQVMNVVVVPTLLIYNASGEKVFSHEGFKPGDRTAISDAIEQNLDNE